MFSRPKHAALAALAMALAALGLPAAGESNTSRGRPGFFEPTPDGDPSLHKAPPAVLAAAPVVAASPAPAASPEAPAAVVAPPQPQERMREAEAELDRAQVEHAEAAQKSVQSATTIQGAFTGLTSERDR